ncbi:MAG: hypothetical protein PHR44_04390 [Candidatus Omnitrophica bacterium]|nr:hypothetical protein [Candidatus Omnitrophota bacterium]
MSTYIQQVTDVRSNSSDQIHFAAKLIRRSRQKKAVFKAIYRGKKQIKSISEIEKVTDLNNIQILKAGGTLAGNGIVKKVKKGYQKDTFYAQHYRKILSLASNSKKLKQFPTKTQPYLNSNIGTTSRISLKKPAQKVRFITIDDIYSFRKIKDNKSKNNIDGTFLSKLPENEIKSGIAKIIRESGIFKDWAGEKNDLFTTKVSIGSKRVAAVFAFKGKGTKGILTLDKMGKRADQIQRLFDSQSSQLFIVVYKGQIGQVILEQMYAYAIAKALYGKEIYYGIIDGDDLMRLISSYKNCFE